MAKRSPETHIERTFSDDSILLSTTDLKGRVTYANDDFCQIAGYSKSELMGHGHNIVRHPDMPKAAFANLWQTIKQGKSWMGPVKNHCKNGDHYWVNAYVTPIKDEQGNIFEYQSIRTKPNREVVERAEKIYQQINTQKVPFWQKIANVDITRYIQNLLIFITLFLTIASASNETPLYFSLPLLLLCTTCTALFYFWRKRYKKLLHKAEQVFDNSLMSYLYSGTVDKIGHIDLALDMRKAELNAIIGRVKDLSSNVNNIAQETANNGDHVASMLAEQNVEIEHVATAMGQMTIAIQEVASSVTGAAQASNQGREISEQGVAAVDETMGAIKVLSQQLSSVESVINKLANGRHAIATISDEISSIADQTNLLALNAAIEAARAGEQGRGFAVVAEEVRALALRTQQSTEEIKTTLDALNQESTQAVAAIDEGVSLVNNCVSFAENTGSSLGNINTEVDHIASLNHQIASSVEEQSVVAQQVSNNANSIQTIANQGVCHGHEAKHLSENLLHELTVLHNLIVQFDTK